jgi:Glycosyltransferase like family
MIAFGASMTAPETYARVAEPGIRRTMEADSVVFAHQAAGSLPRTYNLILDQAGRLDDLEALVLVHQDAEIDDAALCTKLRGSLADPEVGVVGCVGATGVRSIAWWEGDVSGGSAVYCYGESGGGELPALSWGARGGRSETGEVEAIDGFLMALSPWVVRNVRFDESLGMLHGFDVDFCLEVRAAGRKVVTADLRVRHHHALDLVTANEPWLAAHMRAADKWEGRLPDAGGDWKGRARRAEAEAALARLEVEARERRRDALEQLHAEQLSTVTESLSWRMTEPLRRLNAWRRARSVSGS